MKRIQLLMVNNNNIKIEDMKINRKKKMKYFHQEII